MSKMTVIEDSSSGETNNFPKVSIKQTATANSFDLALAENGTDEIGNVVIDYFNGELRVLIWLENSDEEPDHKILIRQFSK